METRGEEGALLGELHAPPAVTGLAGLRVQRGARPLEAVPVLLWSGPDVPHFHQVQKRDEVKRN